jgi:predicted transcriptional regulator of viral defense system
MKSTITERLMKFVRAKGIVRASDLKALGIPRSYLTRLVDYGQLQRISRGLYAATDSNPTVNRTLAEACKRVPGGIICLLSALRFHDLTTQLPSQVWMAIDFKARHPREHVLPIRITRFSGRALTEGIETHRIEGVPVRVYSPAKTIADCFKYRNKIGLDVAIEALRDGLRKRKCTVDDLWHYARVCRVSNVLRPYLEATV